MRIINTMTFKDYEFSVNSIHKDFEKGILTRSQAKESLDKLKKSYQSGEVNRQILKAYGNKKGVYIE